ncbi:AlpA family phage regulatory protein [Porticoccaceae bacterium]|nr:AlpA family phage regulatory protein [Porticoccaceae bacterium]
MIKTDRPIPKLLRWRQVSEIIPFSRSHVYDLISKKKFPPPVKLVQGGRAAGWWASDIHDYMTRLQRQTLQSPELTCPDKQAQHHNFSDE